MRRWHNAWVDAGAKRGGKRAPRVPGPISTVTYVFPDGWHGPPGTFDQLRLDTQQIGEHAAHAAAGRKAPHSGI